MNNNINKQLVTIVVPIYKQSITEYEEISFKQLFKILGKHEITIIKPTSLDLNQMLNNYPTCKIESFSDHYFAGIAGYNKLMMSEEFYQRFHSYEYILIYQLAYSKELIASAKALAKKLNCKIITINGNPRQPLHAKYVFTAGPGDWLGLIKNAELVLTNSFHGTVFSILFQKNFHTYLLKKQANRNDRVLSLLSALGLESRISENTLCDVGEPVDYKNTTPRLNQLLQESKAVLSKIIEYEN